MKLQLEQSLDPPNKIQLERYESQKNTFDRLVLEAIDEVFSSLGDLCKKAIYVHLEHEYKLSKKDIPNRIREFVTALHQIFGVGAALVEIEIMKRLRKKVPSFKHSPKQRSLSFDKYVTSLDSFIRTSRTS
jgi:hypothetical protein